jgi:hypothetical protein
MNHVDVARIYTDIGLMWSNVPLFEKYSLENYQKSLAILLNLFGENNIEVANTYHNIGNIY